MYIMYQNDCYNSGSIDLDVAIIIITVVREILVM